MATSVDTTPPNTKSQLHGDGEAVSAKKTGSLGSGFYSEHSPWSLLSVDSSALDPSTDY